MKIFLEFAYLELTFLDELRVLFLACELCWGVF